VSGCNGGKGKHAQLHGCLLPDLPQRAYVALHEVCHAERMALVVRTWRTRAFRAWRVVGVLSEAAAALGTGVGVGAATGLGGAMDCKYVEAW